MRLVKASFFYILQLKHLIFSGAYGILPVVMMGSGRKNVVDLDSLLAALHLNGHLFNSLPFLSIALAEKQEKRQKKREKKRTFSSPAEINRTLSKVSFQR